MMIRWSVWPSRSISSGTAFMSPSRTAVKRRTSRALDGSTFDLMIVDIFMPHMRGFESIRIFHERAPTIPLIAMSGYAFANLDSPAPDFLRMALELGASRCLRKPFTPVALLTVINECLADVQSGCASVVSASHPVRRGGARTGLVAAATEDRSLCQSRSTASASASGAGSIRKFQRSGWLRCRLSLSACWIRRCFLPTAFACCGNPN